jgi:hypothetical protein
MDFADSRLAILEAGDQRLDRLVFVSGDLRRRCTTNRFARRPNLGDDNSVGRRDRKTAQRANRTPPGGGIGLRPEEISDDSAVARDTSHGREALLGAGSGQLGELAGQTLQTLDPASLRRLLHLVVPGSREPDRERCEENGYE